MRPLPMILIGVALLLLGAAPAAGLVAIAYLGHPGETVSLLNAGPDPVEMTGWTLTDERTATAYTFPGFTLAPAKIVTVHAGSGTDSATHLYWSGGRDRAGVWYSDGDLVTLRNATGTRIADSRGFVLGAPTLPRTPVTPLPLVTMTRLPGHPILSPIPTPYITTPPAGAPPYGPYGPIAPPYPTTLRTLAPGQTTLPTVPIPIQQPQWALPTGTPRPALLPAVASLSPLGLGSIAPGTKALPGGKRYAIGKPGMFLGGRFGPGNATAGPGGSRTVSANGTVLNPGRLSFGIAPPRGQFVRWYPAARWQTGIR